MQAVKEPIVRKAIRYLKDNAGYDRNITSTEALRAMIDYIHANPVRRGLVTGAEDWQWSSARWYAGPRPVRKRAFTTDFP